MANAIVTALLPPASLAWFALICFCAGGRWRKAGLAAIVALVVLAVPSTSELLLHALNPSPAPVGGQPPQAIVILSAEASRLDTPGELDPGPLTLERLRAGAALHRSTSLPVLVSGGVPYAGAIPLAVMMGRSLRNDFGVPVRWQEERSVDTWQNARFSADLLRAAGITRVYVVTHAWHMRRSLLAFRHFGLEATPYPVRPDLTPEMRLQGLVPSASAWLASFYALHEWVGLAYYALRR